MEPRRRFRFVKELSEGAFGKVYMAEMITGDNFRSIVAIKLLHGKWLGHEEIVQRSRDEARVLGLLHHRNIIRVEDLTSINGQCAIVMEYLDGVDLKNLVNYLKERGRHVPRKVLFEVVAAVGSALEAAYNQAPLQGGEALHLIHRDIKPSNVMITKAGDVKVLDFGTAQARFDEREAHTQALAFGSAAYMAPERLLGDPDAPSGDVFSLGVTLYELLAQKGFGKVHIRPEKYEESLEERLGGLDLGELGPERAGQVRQVLRLMLAYDPADRPTARQVVDLMEALGDEVHDSSMRRFAREVVAPCRELIEPQPDPEDPLTGSTLFEDRTSGPRALTDSGETVPAPEPETTWAGDVGVSFRAPAGLASPGTPAHLIDDEDDLSAPPEAAVRVGAMSMPGPSIAPIGPVAASPVPAPTPAPAPASPGKAKAPARPPPSVAGIGPAPASPPAQADAAPAAKAVVAAPAKADAAPAAKPVAAPAAKPGGGPAAKPGAAPAAKPVAAPPSETPIAAPALALPAPPAPAPAAGEAVAVAGRVDVHVEPPLERAAPPERPAPASPRRARGRGLIVAVVAVLVMGMVSGAGLVLAWALGLLPGQEPAEAVAVETTEPPPEPAVNPSGAASGGRIEVAALDGLRGSLTLTLEPEGSAQVTISSVKGFKQEWDGSGRLELVGVEPGTYKTKVTPASGSAFRGTLEVQSGKTCTYSFPTTQDGAEWTASGCE